MQARTALTALLAGLALNTAATELRVVPGSSIAQAIAQAQPGDTVLIERGLYHERLIIDKPLTLRGVNRPTLSGGGEPGAIGVRARPGTEVVSTRTNPPLTGPGRDRVIAVAIRETDGFVLVVAGDLEGHGGLAERAGGDRPDGIVGSGGADGPRHLPDRAQAADDT